MMEMQDSSDNEAQDLVSNALEKMPNFSNEI